MSDRPRYLLEIDAELRERQEDQEEIERLTRDLDAARAQLGRRDALLSECREFCRTLARLGGKPLRWQADDLLQRIDAVHPPGGGYPEK